MAPDPSPTEFLGDPLSPVSRKARRDLLIASSMGILVSVAGLVPTRISALGIDLSLPEQKGFTFVLALIVSYFIAAFVSYGLSDVFIWRKQYQDYLERVDTLEENWGLEDQQAYDAMRRRVPDIGWLYRWSKPLAFGRVLFEFALPLLLGIGAAVSLLLKAWHN